MLLGRSDKHTNRRSELIYKISLFNVKKLKEDIHLNKPLNSNPNLNVLITFHASI